MNLDFLGSGTYYISGVGRGQNKFNKDPEWARTAKQREARPIASIIGRPKEKPEAKPKTKPKPEWTTSTARKKDANKPATKQSDYWKESRPDWAKGKSPVSKPSVNELKKVEKPTATKDEVWKEARPDWAKGQSPVDKPTESDIKKLERKTSTKASDVWADERPEWSKKRGSVRKQSTEDIKTRIEEKKKYGYPTPAWASRVRSKDKASDEQDGNKGLVKAELENILGKPKQKVKRRHSSEDLAESYRTNIRKFADHRLSLRVKTRHRPTSNPVKQLMSRKDIRSEL